MAPPQDKTESTRMKNPYATAPPAPATKKRLVLQPITQVKAKNTARARGAVPRRFDRFLAVLPFEFPPVDELTSEFFNTIENKQLMKYVVNCYADWSRQQTKDEECSEYYKISSLKTHFSSLINYLKGRFQNETMFAVGHGRQAIPHPDALWISEIRKSLETVATSDAIKRGDSILPKQKSIRKKVLGDTCRYLVKENTPSALADRAALADQFHAAGRPGELKYLTFRYD